MRNAYSYVDSIELQSGRYFRADFLSHMREHCRSIVGYEKPTRDGYTVQCLWLHQPHREALERLRTTIGPRIARVHVALDITTPGAHANRKVREYLQAHVLPSRGAPQPVKIVTEDPEEETKEGDNRPIEDTTAYRPALRDPEEQIKERGNRPVEETTAYFGRDNRNRAGECLVLYSDRRSKVNGEHCCHIEWRMAGSSVLDARELRSADGILDLNHRKFWESHLRLVNAPSREALAERWLKEFVRRPHPRGQRFPYGSRQAASRRVPSVLLRPVMSAWGEPVCNDLLCWIRKSKLLGKARVADLFETVDASRFLPGPHNPLWVEAPSPRRRRII